MIEFLKKMFDGSAKELQQLREEADVISDWEPEIKKLSDAELRQCTETFRRRLEEGEALEDILHEAFAVVREASVRTLGMRHFDVQLMGGVVLHQGRIAEMKTGEGKTLVATLPVYLNALTGRGVHIITVNDYLAKRDAEWMGAIYEFLGLEVGVVVHGLDFEQRKQAYAADITYGTNNEFGFDYLRDNMVLSEEQMVQRDMHYAIIDEVDSILIDEARTPLIISGAASDSTRHYSLFAQIAPQLKREEDYTVDEKVRSVALTEEGVAHVESILRIENLFDDRHFELNHYLNQALKAKELYVRDRDYVVKDGEVTIVDEFTGRLMPGRRYSDGLHQAIEAKENVRIAQESQTLASITYQNYFRMYDKLAGMTGTAKTEEEEFRRIYGMDVVVIPTNEPMIREDHPDAVYKTEESKFDAVVEDIAQCYERGQPVLVGTISIEKSEHLSRRLKKRGVPHQVLNAKHHEKEAEIIKNAGQKGMVTIATNMAGRGTDIVLGEGVTDLGGLYIIGTERHESRRIDNQLRGRSGRQGDPGESRFYVSLEDDLMRLFGSEKVSGLMDRLGWDDGQAIEHPQISRSIEGAQKKVESRNFEIRKQVLDFDDVMNKQREVIYEQRRAVLRSERIGDQIQTMFDEVMQGIVDQFCDAKMLSEDWDFDALKQRYKEIIGTDLDMANAELEKKKPQEIKELLVEKGREAYARREAELGSESMRRMEQMVLLQIIDKKWMEHLRAMDDLREGIGLRAYGQRDPLMEYRFEAFEMFKGLIQSIQEDCLKLLFRVEVVDKEAPRRRQSEDHLQKAQTNRAADGTIQETGQRTTGEKIGRNDPCPCGSGKKYKKCCGR